MLRRISILILPLALFACSAGEEKNSASQNVQEQAAPVLDQLAEQAKPGTLGAAILDLQTGEMQGVNADKPMPMQSVFKLPLGIYVMHLADQGRLSLEDEVSLTKADLSVSWSPIADRFDERQDYTIEELIRAAVAQSDNTAADVLMKRTGGPEALTRFFQERGFEDFRVDRYEYELQPQSVGLPVFEGQWIGSEAIWEALEAVPLEAQKAAMTVYLADPRDRMSAGTAVRMLAALESGKLLSAEMTGKMMEILESTTTGAGRLKAGVPDGATVYHKTGTGAGVDRVNSATNDIGIVELADGRKFAIAVFLAGSEQPEEERERLIADVARFATSKVAGSAAVP